MGKLHFVLASTFLSVATLCRALPPLSSTEKRQLEREARLVVDYMQNGHESGRLFRDIDNRDILALEQILEQGTAPAADTHHRAANDGAFLHGLACHGGLLGDLHRVFGARVGWQWRCLVSRGGIVAWDGNVGTRF